MEDSNNQIKISYKVSKQGAVNENVKSSNTLMPHHQYK